MNGYVIRRVDLRPRQRRAMYRLLKEHFDGVNEVTFTRDLSDKNWVVLVEDDDGRLCGFSTLAYYDTTYHGRTIGVVCSGDTIVEQRARSSHTLLATWLDAVFWLGRDLGPGRLYWLLISSGYRTYRCLPAAFRTYHPACDGADTRELGRLADRLARQRWGDAYEPHTGLVHLANPQRLKPEVSPLTARLLRDPHIAFFVRRNPGHAAGDELVCLAPLERSNLTAVGRRLLYPSTGRRGPFAEPVPARRRDVPA
jgi:hypothetical protein